MAFHDRPSRRGAPTRLERTSPVSESVTQEFDVSVVTAVYDVARYLPEFTASLEAQRGVDLSRIEVVAVDDGSTDDSLEVLRAWAARSRLADLAAATGSHPPPVATLAVVYCRTRGRPAAVAATMRFSVGRNGGNAPAISGSSAYSSRSASGGRVMGNSGITASVASALRR